MARPRKAEPPAAAEFQAGPDVMDGSAQGRLRSLVERLERLEEDKAAIAGDIKEVFAEAKGEGFDTKVLRKVLRWRRQDAAKRAEEEAVFDLYLHALGDTPIERLARGGTGPADGLAKAAADLVATVPKGGSMSIIAGGKGVKLSRAEDGGVEVEEVGGDTTGEEAVYAEAVKLVRRDGNASTSYVQRRLGLGYNRAASLVERMEREGVVGPADHAGKREVLAHA